MICFCQECILPDTRPNLEIGEDGVCTACFSHRTKESIDWPGRVEAFREIVEQAISRTERYDCVIPVSGGKDSYYQTHIICKEFNLKPLLVTYDGNNWLPEGIYNRNRMKHLFNADHVMWSPSVEVIKKLNRIAFKKMGDMNWQNHCGIATAPIITAVQFKILLLIWGETEWDIAGMYQPDDYVEFSARSRLEHSMRGYDWYNMIDEDEGIEAKHLMWARYPSDDDIESVGVRGIYIGNFFKWDPNWHTAKMQDNYDFEISRHPFERTYRRFSNLDDMHENGIHDYLKYIKFGYGRASDHASKDIRSGHLTREEGIAMVKKYDHVVSSDLYHWLDYVDMKEEEFWRIADTFRDLKIWKMQDGQWWKDNIWGEPSAYGSVHLKTDDR